MPRFAEFRGRAKRTCCAPRKQLCYLFNKKIGWPMIQHGSQEKWGGHTDETLDVFTPYDDPTLRIYTIDLPSQIQQFYTKILRGRMTKREMDDTLKECRRS